MRPSGKGVGVPICCCKLGAALAGNHKPNINKLTSMHKIKNRFGFIKKIISDSNWYKIEA